MMDLNRYRIKVGYKGFEGLSEIGFKERKVLLEDLFPTADKVLLSMKGYFHKLGDSASIIYEVPNVRFDVVETDRLLELAMENPRGDSVGIIVDILACDSADAQMMMDDIETACGFVKATFRDAMGIMEMSEEDYMERLKYSMRLLANELHG